MDTGVAIQKIYPLSPLQEGLLFHWLMDNHTPAYFIQWSFTVEGILNVELLEKSFSIITSRHDIFRTNFYVKAKKPLQVVFKERPFTINYNDISHLTKEEQGTLIKRFNEEDRENGFDLTNGTLMRVTVLQTGPESYRLVWSHHHILMDGWCLPIITNQLFQIYDLLSQGKTPVLKPVQEYSKFIEWLQVQDKEEALKYWGEYLEGYEQLAVLPKSNQVSREDSGKFLYEINNLIIEADWVKKLEVTAQSCSVTLNIVFQCLWGILLQKYNNQNDVVYGMVISGRPPEIPGIESIIGLFSNTIPLRIKSEPGISFADLAKQVYQSFILSIKYGYLSLPDIQSSSQIGRGLVDHLIAFENYPRNPSEGQGIKQNLGLKISDSDFYSPVNYDFAIAINTSPEMVLEFIYNAAVYSSDYIERLKGHFKELVRQLIDNPYRSIEQFDILTEAEKQTIIYDNNRTAVEYPWQQTISQLFEAQAQKTPERIALVYDNETLTYKDLDEKTSLLARLLAEKGVKPNCLVGLMLENSPETIIGILGILKAGGAYVPIDTDYPPERISTILNDSDIQLLLTKEKDVKQKSFSFLQSISATTVEASTTCKRDQIRDFDSLPLPDRTLIDYEKYNQYIGQGAVKYAVAIQATRGCPYNCAYCHKLWPKTHIKRSAENIFSEVSLLYNLGVRRFVFVDDVFNLDVQNTSRFFRLIIENGLKLQMFFPNGLRGDILTKEYIDLMIEAGTVGIDLALETASPRLQELVGKKLNIEKLRENINYIIKNYPHVILELNVMIGFPTETEEEALMTLDFVESLKWVHFPYIHIVKFYPGSEMAKIAIEKGISKQAIERTISQGYHETSKDLVFSPNFVHEYQAKFLQEYFLLKERLLKVLPVQMKILSEDELVQKYNSYLPMKINNFDELLQFTGITREELEAKTFIDENQFKILNFNVNAQKYFPKKEFDENSLRILLLDLSGYFSKERDEMVYNVVEPPLGLMYLFTYVNQIFGNQVNGKIAKAGVDFDSYKELHELINEFKPDMIGIRTLTFYREFFHQTVSLIRQWGITVPIITGGPYATSSYATILKDRNIDLVVLGEGEITFRELIKKVIENNKKLPNEESLRNIPGIAFISEVEKVAAKEYNREIILLDHLSEMKTDTSRLNLIKGSGSSDLAYVIYTSGSTGTPKGVGITQQGLVNYIWWAQKVYLNGETLDFPLYSSISFDLTVTSIFTPLISGSKVVIYHDQDKTMLIRKILTEDQVGVIKLTPTHLLLLDGIDLHPVRVKKLIIGGEDLRTSLAERIFNRFNGKVDIYNEYGPTETVVGCMIYRFDPVNDCRDSVPIGVPIDNAQIYLLNRELQPVPVGVDGEIFISGDGLARGYLNQPELTHERFMDNPFESKKKMYRTGDLGRWLPGKKIEFGGRLDHQVKIRGYRIELGEIEARISKHDAVKEAVVVILDELITGINNKYLCAYYTADVKLTGSQLREYLSAELPEYMIPERFIQIEKLPLTVNGKIDRKALLEVNREIRPGSIYVTPQNEIETKLIEIWQEVLGIEKVGTGDNFFDLGGQSLKAMILGSRIHKEFNVQIPLAEIFDTPTIKDLAQFIGKTTESIYASIEPVVKKEYYPVSSAQKRLHILNQFEGIGSSYNVYGALIIEGGLKRERLETVFKELINRHEALRTSFIIVDELPVQRVHDQYEFALEYMEVEDGNDARIESLIKAFIRPFDLSKAPLFRAGLIKRSENNHVLIFDMHHIITDGISMVILEQDFVRLYNGEELPKLRLQYKDFSEWQNELFKSDKILEQEKYWLERFQGELPILNFPTDYPRPPVQSFEGDRISIQANLELTMKLNNLTFKTETTMFMLLLAAYNVLLFKYTGQEDIIVGSPVIGRPHPDLENIIGMFVNMLVMRNYPRKEQTFRDFLMTVKETTIKSYENQDYQFEELVGKLKLQRDLSRNPLFDMAFNFNDVDNKPETIEGLEFIPYQYYNNLTHFDLTISVTKEENQISFDLEYCTSLFSKETIHRLSQHYLNILQQITANPEIRFDTLEILSDHEKQQILADFNSTREKYPSSKTLMDLFEDQALQNPGKKAAIFETTEFTYGELNNKANKLAKILREKGVKANDIVAIMTERSPDMLIGLLGILKTGGAYLPVDPAYPPARINYYLSDSGAQLLLKQDQFNPEINFDGEIISIDQVILDEEDAPNPEKINTSRDLAYVIYTSGSTGQPKGVMIAQHSVVNRLNWMQRMYPLNAQDVILQKTTFTFDVSVWELFWWALVGAKVYFLKPGGEKEPESIVAAIIKHQVTVIHFVPSMFSVFLEYLEQQKDQNKAISLRQVFTSGEALKAQQVERFNQLLNEPYRTKLTNLYGPTEATVDVSYFDCPSGAELDRVPIGKPIDNISLYIINENNQIQPIGIPGELCISGVGLAKGYLNRPELTAEKFIPNPFYSDEDSQLSTDSMYRTGDLARWLPDGNIEFLGRIDRQVKIRGFRIELGEIEKQLLSYEPVKDAVVLIREDKTGDKYLAAYFISGQALVVAEIRSYLAEHLPEYMIPSYFVQLEKMPLTVNNKIDTRALPEPESTINTSLSPTPKNEVEKKLERIWQEVLNFERIGIDDDFFVIGGHSLKANILVNKIYKEFNVEVPLGDVFKNPTIKELAKYIADAEQNIYASIEPVLERDYYPLSSAQKRLFILDQFGQVGNSYNNSPVVLIEGELDLNRMENVLISLIQRHDSLRTSFEIINGEPVQWVHREVDFKIHFVELPMDISMGEEFTIAKTITDFIQPFDLSKAPLFRVMIIKIAINKHILVCDLHHIITDELSMNILTRELANLYNGQKLPELRLQYKDFSEWQNKMLETGVMKKQEQYWLERLQGEIPVLNLPTDYPRPVVQSFDGNGIDFIAGVTLTQNLDELALNTETTLFMILLAAYNVLLLKYTGQEDILVGFPIAGRPHPDLENIMGMFVNTLVMRNFPQEDKTFQDFLMSVKETAINAYDNQDYQFESLVDKLKLQRDLGRNPLFDTMFSFHVADQNPFTIPGLQFIPYPVKYDMSVFDLTFSATKGEDQINFNIRYCTKLFSEETMQRFSHHYLNILRQITENPEMRLAEVEILSEPEIQQILADFNSTEAEYPSSKTLIELFEVQVAQNPGKQATIFESTAFTYRELNNKANQLANMLRGKGVQANDIVAIMIERSPEMIIGLLGILKAGGAYLPIDPGYPATRIKYCLSDSGARLLLRGRQFNDDINFDGEIIYLEHAKLDEEDTPNPEKVNTSRNLAYVIYTSGSTGNPKGTLIEHHSVVNRLHWMQRSYPLTDSDVILQKTTFTFDVSVWELFWWAIQGAKACFLRPGGEKDPDVIIETIAQHQVTVIHFVPSMLSLFLE